MQLSDFTVVRFISIWNSLSFENDFVRSSNHCQSTLRMLLLFLLLSFRFGLGAEQDPWKPKIVAQVVPPYQQAIDHFADLLKLLATGGNSAVISANASEGWSQWAVKVNKEVVALHRSLRSSQQGSAKIVKEMNTELEGML